MLVVHAPAHNRFTREVAVPSASRRFTVLALLAAVNVSAQTPHAPAVSADALFQTSDRCFACHSNLTAPSGEDVSIGSAWRASIMANSARDPYWQAAVRREVMDHPQSEAEIEDNCATCHMPMARLTAASEGQRARVFPQLIHGGTATAASALAQDGVSCSICHQIRADNFGTPSSFSGGFVIDTAKRGQDREIFGPFDVDRGRQSVMRSATRFVPTESTHVQQSELCATCHTLYTDALNRAGERVGRLPEQVPFFEWRHSDYRNTRSCQSCHMPPLSGEAPISSVLSQGRAGFSQHSFEGGNAFMLRILNKYRDELGVTALPQELDLAARRTVQFLNTETARVSIDAATASGVALEVVVAIQNLSGHKLPTAYPARRAWLHLTVRDARGETVFESGELRSDGSIVGNDNDADPARFEPHYDRVDRSDQVQIYESVMVDEEARVTTGLLSAVRYIKDSRLLPTGFDKAAAGPDITVHGEALHDADFVGGGDHIRYVVPLERVRGPLTVGVELWFQSIGYRWAHNLKAYDAEETRRFVTYYENTASESAVLLASDSRSVR